jgi:osmotically-inducible protein OsmY
MKTRNIFIRCLILVMFVTVCTACATKPILENTGEFIDDSVITTKIKSQIAGDSLLKAFQISVETFKGTVQLSGFVNSQKDVDRATEISNNVNGVRSLRNNLIVK